LFSLVSFVCLPLAVVRGEDKVDFAKVQPILAKNCGKCHGAEKQAAKLRLDSADEISKYAKKDKLLVAGKPDESELLKRIMLPKEDKKHMPKGGDSLPEAEVAVIKAWIQQGAVLAVAAAAAPAEAKPADAAKMAADEAAKKAKEAEEAVRKADEAELAKVTPAPKEALDKLTAAGAAVMPLFSGSPLVQVSFARAESPAGNEALAALVGAADQIVWLDLSGAQATKAGWEHLAKLKNLNRLHLEKSSIDDAGLANLSKLPRLEYLNLYGTAITDAGLEHLKPIKRLKKLYLWHTKVNYDPAMALQAAEPGREVNLGWDHPGVVKVRLTKELESAKKSATDATTKSADLQKQLEAANKEKTDADARVADLDKQLKELGAPGEKPADAKKAEEEKKAADAKKAEEEKKKADDAKKAEEKKAEEKKAADAKKAEDEKKAAEAKKADEAKKAEEAKKADEAKKDAEKK
jgi:hypothetical protein